ncbi:hypothetical protein [Mycobacteroides abscessus]|uniref:hypothetical protein n=1 Tax=Mycobacteroides abscessus TaxID=36809 RepID=UPI000C258C75|nr:hypothetical protein [Mycobacteroides abscessus]PVB44272.1 hypothetical protein DDJ39_15025 [Mycobacteroides abscessus]
MIAAQPDTTAYFIERDGEDEVHIVQPVIAWDDEGYALIPGHDGRLVRALDGLGFRALDWEVDLWSQVRISTVAKKVAVTA